MITEGVSPVLFLIGEKTQASSWQGTKLRTPGRGWGVGWGRLHKPFQVVTRVLCPPVTFSFQSHGFRTEAEVESPSLPQCGAPGLLPGLSISQSQLGPSVMHA